MAEVSRFVRELRDESRDPVRRVDLELLHAFVQEVDVAGEILVARIRHRHVQLVDRDKGHRNILLSCWEKQFNDSIQEHLPSLGQLILQIARLLPTAYVTS